MATAQEKVRLLRGLLGGEVAQAGPFCVTIDLTRRCNLRCLGCYYHSPLLGHTSPGDQTVVDMPFDLGRQILCVFCCHAVHNHRVHRWFRWFSPLVNQRFSQSGIRT